MTHAIRFALLAFALTTSAYADPQQSTDVTQGSAEYDWQTCVSSKTNECINNTCLTSSALDCNDNCKSIANDKCVSLGLTPPQQ